MPASSKNTNKPSRAAAPKASPLSSPGATSAKSSPAGSAGGATSTRSRRLSSLPDGRLTLQVPPPAPDAADQHLIIPDFADQESRGSAFVPVVVYLEKVENPPQPGLLSHYVPAGDAEEDHDRRAGDPARQALLSPRSCLSPSIKVVSSSSRGSDRGADPTEETKKGSFLDRCCNPTLLLVDEGELVEGRDHVDSHSSDSSGGGAGAGNFKAASASSGTRGTTSKKCCVRMYLVDEATGCRGIEVVFVATHFVVIVLLSCVRSWRSSTHFETRVSLHPFSAGNMSGIMIIPISSCMHRSSMIPATHP